MPLGGSFAEEGARYRLEIAILSQLRHPNLGGLVDVVAGPDDEPLLVLDYLEGAQPITTAAAERRLTVRERIGLFSKVLDALRSAHERGVIHCDLSAANVVVRKDGEPVVIDFGIAKAPGNGQVRSPSALARSRTSTRVRSSAAASHSRCGPTSTRQGPSCTNS